MLTRDSRPPFFSKYSDRRKSLGYMDGAIHSGRHAAHMVTESLEMPEQQNFEPKLKAMGHAKAPPSATPFGHFAAVSVLKSLRKTFDELTNSEAKRLKAGQKWLMNKIIELLTSHGHLTDNEHPEKKLATVRDFIVGLLDAERNGHESITNEIKSHTKAIESRIFDLAL